MFKRIAIFLGILILAAVLTVGVLFFFDFPPFHRTNIIVTTHVENRQQGLAPPSDFIIHVSAQEPEKTSLPGNESGSTVHVQKGAYELTVTRKPEYDTTLSDNCHGTIATGEIKECTITHTLKELPAYQQLGWNSICLSPLEIAGEMDSCKRCGLAAVTTVNESGCQVIHCLPPLEHCPITAQIGTKKVACQNRGGYLQLFSEDGSCHAACSLDADAIPGDFIQDQWHCIDRNLKFTTTKMDNGCQRTECVSESTPEPSAEKQIADSRNYQRRNDVKVIVNAIAAFAMKHKDTPVQFPSVPTELCRSDAKNCAGRLDVRDILTSTLPVLPHDPNAQTGDGTRYALSVVKDESLMSYVYKVIALDAESYVDIQAGWTIPYASQVAQPPPNWTITGTPESRNEQRLNTVNRIANALSMYASAHNGTYPPNIPTSPDPAQEICKTYGFKTNCVDLGVLTNDYNFAIYYDPSHNPNAAATNYFIRMEGSKPVITAPGAENDATISAQP